MSPVPYTKAFGGVATGIMKAHDAPTPMTTGNTSRGNPICTPIVANMGTNNAAAAVLLVISVKKMMNVATTTTTKNAGAFPTHCSNRTANW